ncbi:MAG: hypothetical protein AAF420_05630 [Pseudomonadota bacterium]
MIDPIFSSSAVEHFHSSKTENTLEWPANLSEIMGPVMMAFATAEITQWPTYSPTPLRRFSKLASALGIEEILYKDEASRVGGGSFKSHGGA